MDKRKERRKEGRQVALKIVETAAKLSMHSAGHWATVQGKLALEPESRCNLQQHVFFFRGDQSFPI